MSSVEFYDKSKNRIKSDLFQNQILSTELLNNVIKFHQSGSLLRNKNSIKNSSSPLIYTWLEAVENTDILPDIFEETIKLDTSIINNNGSTSKYDLDYVFPFEKISNVLIKSFGRDSHTLSKRYPSAGALFPIIPLLLIFKENSIERVPDCGVYMIDPFNYSLYKVKGWDEEDIEDLKSSIVLDKTNNEFISNFAIGYAIDIRRSITKYRTRGYRHALIELGSMTQGFRESLLDTEVYYGDLCWSGFNDYSLTYLAGLNVRLAPVTLLQWFGKKKQLINNF
ncbi:hypothetical protein [Sporosarcina limicola]|uniref:SagB-type dehydrogenase family enzyme n=1 Tax=Sporosarcina limicola TaxID=34101 RepID=A0A927RBE1_9BACL|nr:hypothetical protein [Sporosarcina limicola]MBE1553290.1 SagB-type dehydrogenase family enzyme [Sporosarcina limicola]